MRGRFIERGKFDLTHNMKPVIFKRGYLGQFQVNQGTIFRVRSFIGEGHIGYARRWLFASRNFFTKRKFRGGVALNNFFGWLRQSLHATPFA